MAYHNHWIEWIDHSCSETTDTIFFFSLGWRFRADGCLFSMSFVSILATIVFNLCFWSALQSKLIHHFLSIIIDVDKLWHCELQAKRLWFCDIVWVCSWCVCVCVDFCMNVQCSMFRSVSWMSFLHQEQNYSNYKWIIINKKEKIWCMFIVKALSWN